MQHFALMARFNGWANDRLYETVSRVPDADYRRDCGAFFGSIHRTLNHLLVVDRLWTGRIEGIDRGVRSLDQILYEDFESLRRARRDEDARLVALVGRLSPERLASPTVYRRIIGEGPEETRTDHILLTLFNHQTHHRGQVHVLLTQSGVTPPPLDVIFFLEETGLSGTPARPAAQ